MLQRHSCLEYAHYACLALHRRGIFACLQAGDLSWPIVDQALDDGQGITHFSYEWQSPSPEQVKAFLQAHVLPEIHVWCGLPETHEIIDLTTGHLPAIVKGAGFDWSAPPPPEYLWSTHLPDRTLYRAHADATILVARLLIAIKPEEELVYLRRKKS